MASLSEQLTIRIITTNQTSMKTKLAKQIKHLESSITWINDGMMLRTQKQRFYKLMAEQRVLDAFR
jgi:hypothetical protein